MSRVKQQLLESDKRLKAMREEKKEDAREHIALIEDKNAEIEKINEIIRDREFQLKEIKIQKRLLGDDKASL